MKCKETGYEKINGGEIYSSWLSLEPQFNTCNDTFSVDKIMGKLPCKHPHTTLWNHFTVHKLTFLKKNEAGLTG